MQVKIISALAYINMVHNKHHSWVLAFVLWIQNVPFSSFYLKATFPDWCSVFSVPTNQYIIQHYVSWKIIFTLQNAYVSRLWIGQWTYYWVHLYKCTIFYHHTFQYNVLTFKTKMYKAMTTFCYERREVRHYIGWELRNVKSYGMLYPWETVVSIMLKGLKKVRLSQAIKDVVWDFIVSWQWVWRWQPCEMQQHVVSLK
jgi:hypothetical protein